MQVPDAMARYKQLLYYAKKLPPMPQEEHVDENKVKGCVSQVRDLRALNPTAILPRTAGRRRAPSEP